MEGDEYETSVIQVNSDAFEDEQLEAAASLIKKNLLVAFPTETVYGLGANALSEDACKKIFLAKGRPSDNPLIVHVSGIEMAKTLVRGGDIPPALLPLISTFWPGPLTLLFAKGENVPEAVTAGQPTVALRMPSHPVARRLIELSGLPIAAPSANKSGRPSPTSAKHVLTDLSGRIPCVVDGGDAPIGVESTVLNVMCDPPTILRPGGITKEQLIPLLPTVQVYKLSSNKEMEEKPPTPGLKYTHYSPSAEVVLIEGAHSDKERLAVVIKDTLKKAMDKGRAGYIECTKELLSETEKRAFGDKLEVYSVASKSEESGQSLPSALASHLFRALRELDAANVNSIIVVGIGEEHIGMAVMNRLRKAANAVVKCSSE